MEYIIYLVPELKAGEVKALPNPITSGTINEVRFQSGSDKLLVKLGNGASVQQTLVGGTGSAYTSLAITTASDAFISVQNLSDRALLASAIVIGRS